MEVNIINVPSDEFGYPSWDWHGIEEHLLFDIGFSYGMLQEANRMLKALTLALAEQPPNEFNGKLKARLDELTGKIENFEKKRLSARDDLYNAGYLAAARLEAQDCSTK